MKKQKGFTAIELIIVIAILFFIISWVTNFVKFTQCDFEPNYKCEIIHGIGIVPVLSVVAVWFDTDK